ncbi:MAG: hypothetical protein FWD82_07040 [Defluviitaleaceae bacterium]|nr:hypothetical protein [Defluviitaleaceae bacterium]
MLKKIISTILIATLMLPIISTNYSATTASDIVFNIIESYSTDDYLFEVSEHNGRFYFFRDTANYAISMDMCPEDGIINIYHRNRMTDIITFDSINMSDSNELHNGRTMRSEINSSNIVGFMEEMGQLVSDSHIILNNELSIEIINESQGSPLLRSGVHDPHVLNELALNGHRQRDFTGMGIEVTQHGLTGRVFERTTFSTVNLRAQVIARGLTVTAIGLLLSKPTSGVSLVVTLVWEGSNLVSAYQQIVNTHRISVRYVREGRVNGVGPMLQEFRDVQYDIFVGNGNRTSSETRWDTSSWDFNNTFFIAQEAIRIARLHGFGW